MGVSCPTATACMAVGQYIADVGTSGPLPVPLGESWDGTSWKQQTVPVVDDWCEGCVGLVSSLSGASCLTATSCIGVGASNSLLNGPVAEAWNGSTWSTLISVNAYNIFGALSDISCPGPMCMAVGYQYASLPGDEMPLAEMWDGTGWSNQALPAPAGATTSALSSVSCPTTADCIAVGNQNPSGPLAENWNGSTWTIESIPGNVALTGLSCPTTGLCWAVGGNGSIVAEQWNVSAWTLHSLPTPTSATSTSLNGISCPSPSDCVAVGSFTNPQGKAMTLSEQWNGTNWSILPTPNPSDSIASYLSSVSCPTAQTCTAVGYYENTSNSDLTLAESFSR
jgi:hypothetical protein